MVIPCVLTRMKERNEVCVDMRREIRPFVKIAPVAGQAQIGLIISATVLSSDDMLDMKGDKWQIFLPAVTVLTAVLSPLSHETA